MTGKQIVCVYKVEHEFKEGSSEISYFKTFDSALEAFNKLNLLKGIIRVKLECEIDYKGIL